MKKRTLLTIITGIVILTAGYLAGSFFPMMKTFKIGSSISLKTEIDSFSYAFGLYQGGATLAGLNQAMIGNEFPKGNFISGVEDGLNENKEIMDQMAVENVIQNFSMKQQEKMMQKEQEKAEVNLADGVRFLETNKTRAGVSTTESGLQYEVLARGNGISPRETDSLTVHYTGTLLDGKVFDSSVDRGEPITFKLGQVIKGWTEGLQLMKEGDKFKFFIPSDLAYGPSGSRSIEPNAVLTFEVELIKVIRGK